MFGLYKYSRRPMLHRQAKEGQVQVLFEHLGQTYLICRTITMTKAGGDSVITRLYRIQNAKFKMQDDLYSEVLNRNVESLEFLLKTESEEIPFKSGVELEATLASLLPPQEVIESSSILLQESDNIFEMTPGERINIFKHLF
jgi:DNA repair exonuclease SbcCD ATPase subunit